jgi:hypothetical protein
VLLVADRLVLAGHVETELPLQGLGVGVGEQALAAQLPRQGVGLHPQLPDQGDELRGKEQPALVAGVGPVLGILDQLRGDAALPGDALDLGVVEQVSAGPEIHAAVGVVQVAGELVDRDGAGGDVPEQYLPQRLAAHPGLPAGETLCPARLLVRPQLFLDVHRDHPDALGPRRHPAVPIEDRLLGGGGEQAFLGEVPADELGEVLGEGPRLDKAHLPGPDSQTGG